MGREEVTFSNDPRFLKIMIKKILVKDPALLSCDEEDGLLSPINLISGMHNKRRVADSRTIHGLSG